MVRMWAVSTTLFMLQTAHVIWRWLNLRSGSMALWLTAS